MQSNRRHAFALGLTSALSLALAAAGCSSSDAADDADAASTATVSVDATTSASSAPVTSTGGSASPSGTNTTAAIPSLSTSSTATSRPTPSATQTSPVQTATASASSSATGAASGGGGTNSTASGNAGAGGEPADGAGGSSGGVSSQPSSAAGAGGDQPLGNGGGGALNVGGAGGGDTAAGGAGGAGEALPGSEDAPCEVPDFIFAEPVPVGWASQSGGTTGGGSAEPILVTSLQQLQAEVEGDTPKVIYVQGELAVGVIDIGSNKTILGCSSGAHLRGKIAIGSGSSNLILRNLEISGYADGNCALDPDYDSATGCSSGSDAVGVNGDAHHVWFDHCWVKNGTDGNLDVTNNADFVTVSWTKFSYSPRTDDSGDDSTGAAGHRFSNLVGGTDTAPEGWPGTVPLNVTWHHNWWADNVVERQPRVRYGRNHLFNNYYDSATSNYCVRAGIEASVLLQGNYFDGVDSPHQFNNDEDRATAFIALGSGNEANTYAGTTGDEETEGGGEAFTPPYEYSVEPADDVPASVMAGAGPQ